jgi:hypothetical protein
VPDSAIWALGDPGTAALVDPAEVLPDQPPKPVGDLPPVHAPPVGQVRRQGFRPLLVLVELAAVQPAGGYAVKDFLRFRQLIKRIYRLLQ